MSRKRITGTVGALGVLAFVAAAAVPAPPVACTVSFEPGAVQVQEDASQVTYTLSEPIGNVAGATIQEGAGVEVTGHNPAERTIELSTAAARAGEWTVTLHGEGEAICEGTLEVRGEA